MGLAALADNSRRDSLSCRYRSRRMAPLLPFREQPLRVLDIGGTAAFWRNLEEAFHQKWRITLLNLSPAAPEEGFEIRTGDATRMTAADLAGYDLIFSNSVIEHLGSWAAKRRLAEAILGSGLAYFVQTPNYWFPMEPHWLIPGFQYLPRRVQRMLLLKGFSIRVKNASIDEAEALLDEIQLLTRRDVLGFFPGASLLEERFYGLTKSFVAHDPRALATRFPQS